MLRRRHPFRRFAGSPAWKAAFTLVELLVVIAVIGVLAALLLPSLNKTKLKADGVGCLNNHRQLAIAWSMYSDDNNDELVFASENPWDPSTYGSRGSSGEMDFNPTNAVNWDPDLSIKRSPLWSYSGKNPAIWRCRRTSQRSW